MFNIIKSFYISHMPNLQNIDFHGGDFLYIKIFYSYKIKSFWTTNFYFINSHLFSFILLQTFTIYISLYAVSEI